MAVLIHCCPWENDQFPSDEPHSLQEEVAQEYDVDPLSDDLAVSIHCAPKPLHNATLKPVTHYQAEFDSDPETGSGFEIPGDETAGTIPHLPTVPLDQQPAWMQTLFNTWMQTARNVDDTTTIYIRSCGNLHPCRYFSIEVWRPVLLPPSPDGWWNCTRAVWHDLFEHDFPVEGYTLHIQTRKDQLLTSITWRT